MPSSTKRVAIYARVSTIDKNQDPETQLRVLRDLVRHHDGWSVADEFVDHASGGTTDREKYQELLDRVRKRQVDVVLVYRYNRFARSTRELINSLEEFRALDVDFISYSENIDTTTPQGRFFFTVIAGFAELEREQISENVRAGMARARAQGKQISRPRIPEAKQKQIRDLAASGKSKRAIARELGVNRQTVTNYLRECRTETTK